MLRTRRRQIQMLRGMDAAANRWVARARHAKKGLGYLHAQAQAAVALEPTWSGLTETALDEKLVELRAIFARRRHEDEHVRQAFAAVREVARRTTGEHPYPVQVMGAMGLFHGQIVEMVTGEGKTLTASLAAAVLGWTRQPVHVVTVNDYLAQRDADSRNPIFKRCGLVAGAVVNETKEPQRLQVYRLPIVYTSAKEVMADWLRDQLRLGRITDPVSTRWLQPEVWQDWRLGRSRQTQVMVPGLFAAIVDEIDAILIDEAVTPLIIAQDRGEDAQGKIYSRARELALQLTQGEHFKLKLDDRQAELTTAGREKLAELVRENDHALFRAPRRGAELVSQALVADLCYHKGEHYQVVEKKIVIVDEYTGRFMADRQWQHGLHQAVEAKEQVPITADRDTLASISFQRYFRQYRHLCGMTGTAAEAAPEMERTYGLPVRIIPTHRLIQRRAMPDRIFVKAADKWTAVANEVARLHQQGRPVLVGTRSIDASEKLGELLQQRGLSAVILNAEHHKVEAEIISKAGQRGAITVATNMAGRGTDIKLGAGVAELGGLHVLLTERHTARRVDRQFIGRAGRQGDPGSSQVFCALEDDLVIKYAPRLAKALRRRYEGRGLEAPGWTSRVFDWAQRTATRRSLASRLMLIRQDHDLDKSLPR